MHGAPAVHGRTLRFTANESVEVIDWDASGVDVVIESTGRWRRFEAIKPHLSRGVKRVAVAAPVKHEPVLNIVMDVNDNRFEPGCHRIVTAGFLHHEWPGTGRS